MIASIPLHPLFVHAAVAFIPLAALASIAFTVKPQWRYLLRWPTGILALGALLALLITRETGEMLWSTITDQQALIERHDLYAGLLTGAAIPLLLLVLFAVWSFGSTSGLVSGKGAKDARYPRAEKPITWIVVILALATLIFTVLTGHSGATAVWSA